MERIEVELWDGKGAECRSLTRSKGILLNGVLREEATAERRIM